jgi:hypothetical protein
MIRRLRPSPAMGVALLALLMAVGGTSYAAVKLPAKSVGTPQLKNKAVTTPKLKNGAVTGAKLQPGTVGGAALAGGSVTAAHVANDTLTGNQISEGTLGPVPTATSATSAGIQSLTYFSGGGSIPANSGTVLHGDCPAGLRPISGGLRVDDPSTMYVIDGYPQGNGWTGNAANTDGVAHGFTGYVVCAQAGANAGPAPKSAPAAKVRHYRLAR